MPAEQNVNNRELEGWCLTSRPMEPVPANRSSQREPSGSRPMLPVRDWIIENTAARTCGCQLGVTRTSWSSQVGHHCSMRVWGDPAAAGRAAAGCLPLGTGSSKTSVCGTHATLLQRKTEKVNAYHLHHGAHNIPLRAQQPLACRVRQSRNQFHACITGGHASGIRCMTFCCNMGAADGIAQHVVL